MARRTRTLIGLALVTAGALLGMLAMTALPWYRGTFGGILDDGTDAAHIRSSISFYEQIPVLSDAVHLGISPLYFRWLAVVLVLLGALVALLAVGLDGRLGRLTAAGAVLIAVGGLVATAFAVQYVHIDAAALNAGRSRASASTPPGYGDFVGHTSFGAWAIVLAFVAIGVGAVLLVGGRDSLRVLLADADDDPDDRADRGANDGDDDAAVIQPSARPAGPDERPW